MNAILIARVSTEEQKEAGNSLPAQVARLEKYCQNKGFTIIQTCSFDESAYTNNRTELDRIIDLIFEQKEKVAVCCDKVDRLSRNIFDKRISMLYEKALSDEIELHFVSDGQVINSKISAVEKFQFGISLGLAKYYSDAISDNVKRALEQKLRKGEWASKAPYGYKNITKADGSSHIIVDEYTAHIAIKVFELYATGAFSMGLLCAKLKKDYNLDWGTSHIDKISSNHFYYGIMRVKGNMYPHHYPPLISKVLFEQVQEVKRGFNKKPYRYANARYLYRGLLRCAECGFTITPETKKGHIYYHCTQYEGKHGATYFREEALTKKFEEIFKRLQMPKHVVENIIEMLDRGHQDKVEFHKKQYEKLSQEHKTVSTMLDNLYLDKLKGRITESAYDKFYTSLRDQATDLSVKLEQLQGADDNYVLTAKHLLNIAIRAYDLFIGSEVEEKRQLIKLILSNLKLNDENIVYIAHEAIQFDLQMFGRSTMASLRGFEPLFSP